MGKVKKADPSVLDDSKFYRSVSFQASGELYPHLLGAARKVGVPLGRFARVASLYALLQEEGNPGWFTKQMNWVEKELEGR